MKSLNIHYTQLKHQAGYFQSWDDWISEKEAFSPGGSALGVRCSFLREKDDDDGDTVISALEISGLRP